MPEFFRAIAHRISVLVGSPIGFISAVLVILLWAVSGPLFGFSNTWQLVINTGTTIVTFLMVFLIQNTQNREARAIQIKLDELIRAVQGAREELIDLEEQPDIRIEEEHDEVVELARQQVEVAQEEIEIAQKEIGIALEQTEVAKEQVDLAKEQSKQAKPDERPEKAA